MTTNESPAAWLAALAPGDEVVVVFKWEDLETRTLSRVSRVTAARVFVRWGDSEIAYDCHDGRIVGGTLWHIAPVTPEYRATLHRAAVLDTIITTQWHDLPTATLERIAALVEVPR